MPRTRLDIFTAFNVLAQELEGYGDPVEFAVRNAIEQLRRGWYGLAGETAAEHIRNAQMMLQCAKDAMPKGSEDVVLSLTAYDAIACRLGLALGAL